MNSTDEIRLGSSLYSFTNEFLDRRFGLADLVREMARRQLGPGLEAVGFQSFRSFPNVTDAEAAAFAEIVEETGLEPTCLGISADRYLRPGRPISDEELVDFHERQLKSAAKLGFPIVRFQHGATPPVIRKLVPLAEELDIKLGMEIHAPLTVRHPIVLAYREMYDEAGSDCLGFIPDFGATAREVPPIMIAGFRKAHGIPERVIGKALEIWHDDSFEPFERSAAFLNWCEAQNVEDRHAVEVQVIFAIINRSDPESWGEIMPRVFHVHGKFYDIDPQTGEDVAIDFAANCDVLVKHGYQGFISSEWEGHLSSKACGFARVAAQHDVLRTILGQYQ